MGVVVDGWSGVVEISPIYSYGRYVCAFPEIITIAEIWLKLYLSFHISYFPAAICTALGAYRHQTNEANQARLPPPLFLLPLPHCAACLFARCPTFLVSPAHLPYVEVEILHCSTILLVSS